MNPTEEFVEAIKDWGKYDRTASEKKMSASDRKDLRRVLSLYRKGKYAEAYETAQHLDTIVREVIPDRIWYHIREY